MLISWHPQVKNKHGQVISHTHCRVQNIETIFCEFVPFCICCEGNSAFLSMVPSPQSDPAATNHHLPSPLGPLPPLPAPPMPNKLHQIRLKDATLKSLPPKSLSDARNKHLERKQLSSAYQRRRQFINGGDNSQMYEYPMMESDENGPLSSSMEYGLSTNGSNDSSGLHHLPTPESQLTSQKFSTMGNADELLRKRQLEMSRGPSSRDGVRSNRSYFVESLKDLCAKSIASNFQSNPIDLEKQIQNPALRRKIQDHLSVRIPLQISVPKIENDDYWRRCCEMRWTDGQIGSFLRSDTQQMLLKKEGDATPDASSSGALASSLSPQSGTNSATSISELVPQPRASSWKQLYLEQNLQEFLESIQSELSIAQELHVLTSQPEKDEEGHVSSNLLKEFQTETNRMRDFLSDQSNKLKEEAEKRKKKKGSKKAKKVTIDVDNSGDNATVAENESEAPKTTRSTASALYNDDEDLSPTSQGTMAALGSVNADDTEEFVIPSSDPATYQLHSHWMKPNLNYYLLHTNPDDLPTQKYREKLKNLFDGSESINNSRLTNLSNDDDIFTFYDNAIYRSYYKTHNHKSQYAFKDIQYWLLAKKDQIDQDPDVRRMLQYVKQENLGRLKELSAISNQYVRNLEIKAFRSHIDLTTVLDLLPNLTHLQLSYRVLNAGMSFDLDMCGMKQSDAKFLSSALADASIAPNLISLNLSENMITDNLLKGILVGLVKNDHIVHLDLSHNKITEDGVMAIGAFLKKTKCLKSLNLCDNNVRQKGAMYLAEGLKNNNSLQYLDLRLNRFGDLGGKAIFEALKSNQSVTYLNVSHNELGSKTLGAMLSSLKQPDCKLTHLDISGNSLPEEAGHEILDMMEVNKSIVHLHCRRCGIQTSDMSKIAAVIQKRRITSASVMQK